MRGYSATPPTIDARPEEITQHGVTRVDDYAWLRDEKWQDVLRDPSTLSPEIGAALAAENQYYEAASSHLSDLRETLFEEMRSRIKEDDMSPPAADGPYEYYSRYRKGGEYPVFARRPRGGGEEEMLYDGDAERGGSTFFEIGAVEHSPNHELIAYSADRVGSEYFEIRLRRAGAAEDLDDVVANADEDMVWAADSKSFYYVERDENQRPRRVKRHVVGAPATDDELVYEETDESYFLGVGQTQDQRYVLISSSKATSSEVRFLPSDAPNGAKPTLIAAREADLLYSVEHHDGHFYVTTNADGAVDFKVMKTDVTTPARSSWSEWLKAKPGVLRKGVLPFKSKVVRLESENALPRLVVADWNLKKEKVISFDEAAYALGLSPGYEYDTDTLRFVYESPTTPSEVFDYDMKSGKRTLIKRTELPRGHDKSLYVGERVTAESHDGAKVPITVLRLKSTKLNGSASLFLYGYGSYGISTPATFNARILSLVDRGMVYAIAHVRGGADLGRQWYLEGKLGKKENSFLDFTSAAAALHKKKYAAPEKTVIFGGSAGGLLVGGSLNLRPELFGGAIAAVPFVDVLNTISDASLPLTPPEWSEWGDPIQDKTAFETIERYSPYDNIQTKKPYPPILATGGIADYRVTYWEPAKWVAKMRAKASGGPFFLRMDMGAGHGGAAARFERLKEYAEYYAFALDVVGQVDRRPVEHG